MVGGETTFHTTTFYGNKENQELKDLVDRLFPHDYVLRKRHDDLSPSIISECFPHDYVLRKQRGRNPLIAVPPVLLSTRLRSTETLLLASTVSSRPPAFHTTTFYGNPALVNLTNTTPAAFHTTTFYGNPPSSSSAAKSISRPSFHTTTFYGNCIFEFVSQACRSTFHTTTFYGNLNRNRGTQYNPHNFPHDYVLRKRIASITKSATSL